MEFKGSKIKPRAKALFNTQECSVPFLFGPLPSSHAQAFITSLLPCFPSEKVMAVEKKLGQSVASHLNQH